MKDILKGVLLVTCLYLVYILFIIAISCFLPFAVGAAFVWVAIKSIKKIKNG